MPCCTQHIALPRGCLDAALVMLKDNGIRCDLQDERFAGKPIQADFVGKLRPDQEQAVAAMLKHNAGVLCAPTAFGKTVTAAAIIAQRGVNTLVLVHRTELLKQWQERLQAFLGVGKGGVLGLGHRGVLILENVGPQPAVDGFLVGIEDVFAEVQACMEKCLVVLAGGVEILHKADQPWAVEVSECGFDVGP